MEIKVISEKENILMKRREILVSIDYQEGPTPNKAELQKRLAEQFKFNIENVEIVKILSDFGISKGKAWIKIWQEKKVPIYSVIKREKTEKSAVKEEIKTKEEVKVEEKKE